MRQLRVMCEHLPPDSAMHRAVRGHAWGDAEYMLAQIIDYTGTAAVLKARSMSKRPASIKAPKPWVRPTDRADEERKQREREEAERAYADLVGVLTPQYA